MKAIQEKYRFFSDYGSFNFGIIGREPVRCRAGLVPVHGRVTASEYPAL